MSTPGKQNLEVGPGQILRRFTEDEAQKLANQWIAIFARNAQGANLKAYLWHTFCNDSYPSACKRDAELLYAQQIASEIIVLSNDRLSAVLTDALPKTCNVPDFTVFPPSFSWTMAFTHEDGWLGPYFAKHPHYDALVLQDIERSRAMQRKAQEVERARRKGWL